MGMIFCKHAKHDRCRGLKRWNPYRSQQLWFVFTLDQNSMIGKTKDIQKFRHGTIRNIEDHLKQSNGISF